MTQNPGVSSVAGCLHTGDVGTGSTQVAHSWVAGALRLSLGHVRVSVCACMVSAVPSGAGDCSYLCTCQALCRLCQVPQQRRCKPHGLRARHPHPRQASRDQL